LKERVALLERQLATVKAVWGLSDASSESRPEDISGGLLEFAPDALVIVDSRGEIVLLNTQAERLFGYPREELQGKAIEILVPERFRKRHPGHRDSYLLNPGLGTLLGTLGEGLELYGLRKDGTEFPVEISIRPFETENGVLVSSAIRDVTERKKAERALREGQDRFQSAFDNAPIGMALIDLQGCWLQVNNALCRITGYSEAELKATTPRAITHPKYVDCDAEDLRQLLHGAIRSYQSEKRYRHAWGHYVWVLETVSLVRDAKGDAFYLIMQVQDITGRKEFARRLEHLVDHDFLTGLFNRQHFERELSQEADLVARYGTPGAVLLIDLDNFKTVNDTLGHKAGDDLLKGVAALLRHRMRQTDVVARVGGDEFAILLRQTDGEHAQIVAEEVVRSLSRQTAALGEQSINLTASLGVATFDHLSANEVLAGADSAMYEAKQAGRNRVAMFQPRKGQPQVRSTRFAEAERIRQAIEQDRFLLYCQPILDLQKNEVSQYELLLRLANEEGGEPFTPNTFLNAAERFALIQTIDLWVIRKAIGLIAAQASTGRKVKLSVNLSASSVADPKLAALIEAALAETIIDPTCLVFELAETAAIANIEVAKTFASRLRSYGCQFALDDFGAGFGSFYYLKSLPFDYIKIDGVFIRGIAETPMDQLVVQAMVAIAKGMGKKTIAEFVSDEGATSVLRKIGVDYAQGYHVGRPQPVAEVVAAARN